MIPTSPEFLTTVVGDQTRATRLDVIQDGNVVAELPIFGGEMQADRTAPQPRTCTLYVADEDGTIGPDNEPFFTRIQPWWGVRHQRTTVVRDRDDSQITWAAGNHAGTKASFGALSLA